MLKPTPPKLVITVIGGAKNFELERKKKDAFERGLVKVHILSCVSTKCLEVQEMKYYGKFYV